MQSVDIHDLMHYFKTQIKDAQDKGRKTANL